MKTLLIAGNDSDTQNCTDYLKTIGSENILYRWPLKAIDNIDEIDPQMVVINADDFPRHWKICIQFLRSIPHYEHIPVFLLSKKGLEAIELDKAECLGVRKVLTPALPETEQKIFYNILLQEDLIIEKTSISVIFQHPLTYRPVTGQIVGMFASMIIFKPDNSFITRDIKNGTILKSCTLKIGHAVTEPLIKVLKNQNTEIQLQIMTF